MMCLFSSTVGPGSRSPIIRVLATGLLLGIFGLACSGQLPAPAIVADPLEVTYLANEGFLIETTGTRVLIDALFGAGLPGYPAVPAAVRSRLEGGEGEFAGVTVALATHFHGDHFDSGAVARFLTANQKAVFISTPQAAARFKSEVREAASLMPRFRRVLPVPGETESLNIGGVEVLAFNLHHGSRTPPVENLGLMVTLGGRSFLHLGDTEAKMEDFRPYLNLMHGVDVAILPFWFLTSEWRAEMVRDEIRPEAIVVAHLPKATAETGYFGRWQNYDNVVEMLLEAFPQAHILRRTGDRRRFDPR